MNLDFLAPPTLYYVIAIVYVVLLIGVVFVLLRGRNKIRVRINADPYEITKKAKYTINKAGFLEVKLKIEKKEWLLQYKRDSIKRVKGRFGHTYDVIETMPFATKAIQYKGKQIIFNELSPEEAITIIKKIAEREFLSTHKITNPIVSYITLMLVVIVLGLMVMQMKGFRFV